MSTIPLFTRKREYHSKTILVFQYTEPIPILAFQYTEPIPTLSFHRVWRPGPENDAWKRRYLEAWFIHFQDMVERGGADIGGGDSQSWCVPALPLLQIGQVRNWVITAAHRAGEAGDDYVDSEIQTWPQKWRNSNMAVIF